jgi:LmbE family N-acetylglucosaminyl deacetylase
VATVVFFHAHPDDECMATGGTMAQLVAEGHRVVLVTATDGSEGEVPDGFLEPGEDLSSRRRQELRASAGVIGVQRLEHWDYRDSGMIGTPANEHPDCFWQADMEEVASRLAALLAEERADAITCYDENGVYGHPDHIQVHRVGVRAAELAAVERCYLATVSRERVKAFMAAAPDFGVDAGEAPDVDVERFGVEEARITTQIDVSRYVEVKRRAMEAHASQIRPESFPLSLPPEVFALVFGVESYVRHGAERPDPLETSLLDGSDGTGPGAAGAVG